MIITVENIKIEIVCENNLSPKILIKILYTLTFKNVILNTYYLELNYIIKNKLLVIVVYGSAQEVKIYNS